MANHVVVEFVILNAMRKDHGAIAVEVLVVNATMKPMDHLAYLLNWDESISSSPQLPQACIMKDARSLISTQK